MDAPSATTTSRRSQPFILCSDFEEECKFLLKPWLERPSPLKLSRLIPLTTSSKRFKTKKVHFDTIILLYVQYTWLKLYFTIPVLLRNSSWPAASYLCWKATGRWTHPQRLQHPEGIHSSSCAPTSWRNANFRQNLDWKDHHPRSWAVWFHWQRQAKDSRQRRYILTRIAAV